LFGLIVSEISVDPVDLALWLGKHHDREHREQQATHSMEVKKREREMKGTGSQDPLQGHTPMTGRPCSRLHL
jgi:hypothetical protein